MDFVLHPQLAADCFEVAELPLSRVLLLNDARYPWLVLVPRQAGAVELTDLDPAAQQQLLLEMNAALTWVAAQPEIAKTNIGALGNLVPQLHVHVVGRHSADPAWPGPVWGHSAAESYVPAVAQQRIAVARSMLLQLLAPASAG